MNFLGLLIGPRGATQKSLESQSGARILLRGKGAMKDDENETEPMHVLIQGDNDEQIDTAERLVNELLHNPEKMMAIKSAQLKEVAALSGSAAAESNGAPASGGSPSPIAPGHRSHELRIANEKVGLIIGRAGETIRSLEASTGAQIQISKESGGPDRAVTVVGDDDSINRAVIEIDKICTGTVRPSTSHAGETVRIPVPQNLVGVLIGRGGETVRAVQQRTGCLVQIQRANEVDPSSATRDVSLTGTQQQIEAARHEVLSIIAGAAAQNQGQGHGPSPGHGSPSGGDNMYMPSGGGGGRITVNMDVPNAVVGTIIGRGGETIKRLQQLTGARIQLEKADSGRPQRALTIQGDATQVERARHEVEELIREKQATGGAMVTPNYARAMPQQQQHMPYGAAPPHAYGGYAPQHAHSYAQQYPPHDPYYQPHAVPHGYPGYPQHAPQHAPPAGYGQQSDYYRQPSHERGGGRERESSHQSSHQSRHQSNHQSNHQQSREAASPEPSNAQFSSPSGKQPVDLPNPPTDEAEFAIYWQHLNIDQQQEYYRQYYPDMLKQANVQNEQ